MAFLSICDITDTRSHNTLVMEGYKEFPNPQVKLGVFRFFQGGSALYIRQIIDFLIFTIKDNEAKALKAYGSEEYKDNNNNLCFKGSVENQNSGRKFEFIHYNMGEKSGPTAMGVTVTKALQCWDPLYVIVLGIAAGFERRGVRIGDIIISSDVVHYTKGKRHKGGRFEPRPSFYPSSSILGQFLKQVETYEWTNDPRVRCDVISSYSPSVHIGPILSGEVIMDDPEWVKEVEENHLFKEAIGLEMEAVGAHHAVCETLESTKVITLRCVSDSASNKGDEYQGCATTAVAAFLNSFLNNTTFSPSESNGILSSRSITQLIKRRKLEIGSDFLEALDAKVRILLDGIFLEKEKSRNNLLDPSDLE